MRIEAMREFERLPPSEKLEARIAWLERSVVRLLWVTISLTGAIAGGAVTWILRDYFDGNSLWLLVPFFAVWIGAGIIAQRQAFAGAPPHIDLIDP